MEEARAVLRRVARVERLERSGVPAAELLHEVRALLVEVDAWVRCEGPESEGARAALERCLEALDRRTAPVHAG